jgi:hypothetical protein
MAMAIPERVMSEPTSTYLLYLPTYFEEVPCIRILLYQQLLQEYPYNSHHQREAGALLFD